MTTARALPHVAVLKGGWSAEREVSLVSGRACAEALRREGHRVTEIDVGRDIGLVLGEIAPDVAFNAMHGPYGEDGSIQGVLEVLGIPYTHSGVLASAIAMDKDKAKIVFRAAGLPCAESLIATRQDAAGGHLMEPPYVVKPVNQGSSVGVFIIQKGDNRPPELLADPSWSLGDKVMVERFVPGRELTVAVIEDRPLGVTEIIARSQFYDYDAKYKHGGSKHVLPADVPPAIYRRACDLAVEAHRVLGCRGVSRADFRYDEAGTIGEDLVLLEVNTQPGMTPTSLAPEQAVHAGMTFESLCRWLVEDASCQR